MKNDKSNKAASVAGGLTSATNGPFVVAGLARPRCIVETLVGGAGRGARRSLDAIESFNRASERYEIVPTYVDPVPGKAAALADEATRRGVRSEAVEARVEEVVDRESSENRAPMILHMDRPDAIARVLRVTESTRLVTLVYLLMQRPGAGLTGIRCYLRPGAIEERRRLASFFEHLAEVTLPRGSRAVVGEGAPAENAAIEPVYRRWIDEHLAGSIPKAIAGIEPDSSPMEVTDDGVSTRTLLLHESVDWAVPSELASTLVKNPATPLARGDEFVIAEVRREPVGVRFHTVRLRQTDGRVAVRGSFAVTAPSPEAEIGAEARLDRGTVSRTNPVLTTD